MKKVMIGAVMAMLLVGTIAVFAESEAVNPARVTTPQVVAYSTTKASTFNQVTSYGYPVGLVSTNGDTAVYLTQFGTNNCLGTIQTNTFPVTFIASPAVMWTALSGVDTNVIVISSNNFTTAGTAQPGPWIAVGRIK